MIRLENLTVALGGFTLCGITLEINEGEYFIIVGPTGAGKTILLESIAGLYQVTGGKVWLKGNDITCLEPERRQISIMYQDYSLFPHLNVRDNVLFGLRLRKKSQQEINEALEWIVSTLAISHLLPRKPETLSGGERQKVSLARALVIKPDVLLLDEPLAALDQETRERIRGELRQIHRKFGTTIIQVTHDFEEAMSLGDRIAVLGDGSLKQIGTPRQVFQRPDSEFVAHFVMARNILSGEVKRGNGHTVFKCKGIDILVDDTDISGSCCAVIRPENVIISSELGHNDIPNCFKGNIVSIVDMGAVLSITVETPLKISCLVMRHTFEQLGLEYGQQVYLAFNPSSVHVFK
jgi:molybdate transport system ATP-binding protein/molybdate/tungstate transport system ATP-binding protein